MALCLLFSLAFPQTTMWFSCPALAPQRYGPLRHRPHFLTEVCGGLQSAICLFFFPVSYHHVSSRADVDACFLTARFSLLASCVSLLASRFSQVYSNFELLLTCCEETALCVGPATCLFLAPLIPSIPHQAFFDALQRAGWQQEKPSALPAELSFAHETNRDAATPSHHSPPWFVFNKVWASSQNGNETTCHLALVPGAFCDCIHASQAGIAMAGTATEQLVRGWVCCSIGDGSCSN